MTKVETFKLVTEIVVSVGVGSIAANAIKIATPVSVGLIKKVCVAIGAIVLCNMASTHATNYAEQKIDTTIEQIKAAFGEKSPKEEN